MLSLIVLLLSTCSYCVQTHGINCGFQVQKHIAVCENLNLSYIPPIPDYIRKLIFRHNHLTAVTRQTFQNITKADNMDVLILTSNEITNISPDAFDSFIALTALDLSSNKILAYDLKFVLAELASKLNLVTLKLNLVGHSITEETFSLLNCSPTRALFLNDNDIEQSSIWSLQRLRKLKDLYLRRNHLTDVNFSYMADLRMLWLDFNNLLHVPIFCVKGNVSLVTKLRNLYLNFNLISTLNKDTFKCLPNLRVVELKKNVITEVGNNLFFYTPNIFSIDLGSNLREGPSIKPHAFRSPTLQRLQVGFNGEALKILVSLSDTFKGLPTLKMLSISYMNMQILSVEQKLQLFSPLTNLTNFWCYMCHLRGDPHSIFQNKPYLQKINLKGNFLEELTLDTEMNHVQTLLIGNNKITHVRDSSTTVDILNNLRRFDMSNNPFTCDCNIVWFIDWLKTHKSKLGHKFPNKYKCASPSELTGKYLIKVHFPYLACHPFTVAEWFGIVAGPLIVVILILSLIIYRHRWNIRHYIYLLRKRNNYVEIQGKDYEYDAFISYTQEDCQWVRHFLLRFLEEELKLKVCVHDRDFQAGVFINDNIVECMNKSKKVILVLSNAFANSGWCKFELKVANSLHIEEDVGVMAVLLEKLLTSNIDRQLKLLLETTTYLEWTDQNIVGHELFLAKLKDFMGL